ncbi:hypothetical protein COLO4_13353 [Corchorus olitorius]|uniref:Uncharacterized protein n=1 Tax=Corchorus olitorius TaxID=93759 RepID=A0A1R3JWU6_9ROSI|nr:hypothetical protein COLO4_13353 [Corchorus olitorius]
MDVTLPWETLNAVNLMLLEEPPDSKSPSLKPPIRCS